MPGMIEALRETLSADCGDISDEDEHVASFAEVEEEPLSGIFYHGSGLAGLTELRSPAHRKERWWGQPSPQHGVYLTSDRAIAAFHAHSRGTVYRVQVRAFRTLRVDFAWPVVTEAQHKALVATGYDCVFSGRYSEVIILDPDIAKIIGTEPSRYKSLENWSSLPCRTSPATL
jgi:hypothetical protein